MRGDVDHPVQFVAPRVPGHEFRRAYGQALATHTEDPDEALAVGLDPDHAVQTYPGLVGRGAPVLVEEWLRATVL